LAKVFTGYSPGIERAVLLPDGGFVATGAFQNDTSFGDGLHASSPYVGLFIGRWAPDGSPVWLRTWPNSEYPLPRIESLAIDSLGMVVVAGHSGAAIDFGGGELPTDPPFEQVFVAKLDDCGGHVWSTRLGRDADISAIATVAADRSILLTGYLADEADLGVEGMTPPPGKGQIYTATLSP
jgi:hypothetical protein